MEKFIRLPKVSGNVEVTFKRGDTITSSEDGAYPEGLMAYAESVVGNGLARVAVCADFAAEKDHGNGVGSSVTISLSCNQDDTTINNVAQTLGKWTQALAKQNWDVGNAEYQQSLAAKKQGPANFKP